MEELNHILNHDSNLSIVHDSNASGGGRRIQVLATRPLAPGDAIGPSRGIAAESVLDPVEVLGRRDAARTVPGVGGDGGEAMAFWLTLSAMGRDAEERRLRLHEASGERDTPRKKRRRDADASDAHDGGDDGGGVGERDSDPTETAARLGRRERTFDAYLLSLPREGPDPCCWSEDERSRLLGGTPLAKQIDTTLKKARGEYGRAAAAFAARGIGRGPPPFCIRGRGTFPSVLWARSMHQSRSFPRALLDEEGVWWMGRKKYVAPSSPSSARDGVVGASVLAVKEAETAQEDSDCSTVLSVRLGGWRAPVITLQEEPSPRPPQDSKSPHPKQPAGSTLGIMLPLYDMLDHKPGHAVQWEASITHNNNHTKGQRHIRFRCVDPIAEGETIWNNYGPKGNGELLATYGFASRDNILDSVEGIVLGLGTPPAPPIRPSKNGNDKEECSSADAGDVAATVQVYEARMALIRQHSIPHRFENDNDCRMLLLGPFSLHRKLPSRSGEVEEAALDETTADAGTNSPNDNAPESGGDGVIPEDLYWALSIIGMENVEEGPVVSLDELEMLRDVLTKKLDGFGRPGDVLASASCASTTESAPGHRLLPRAESVEAYKDGQRKLLRSALAELDALMPCDDEEEGTS